MFGLFFGRTNGIDVAYFICLKVKQSRVLYEIFYLLLQTNELCSLNEFSYCYSIETENICFQIPTVTYKLSDMITKLTGIEIEFIWDVITRDKSDFSNCIIITLEWTKTARNGKPLKTHVFIYQNHICRMWYQLLIILLQHGKSSHPNSNQSMSCKKRHCFFHDYIFLTSNN